MKQYRDRALLEYLPGTTSPEQLNMVDFLISTSDRTKGAIVMPLFNPVDYSCLVLIKAAEGELIDRHTWYEGSLHS